MGNNKSKKWDKINLLNCLNKSKSYKECLVLLGLRPAGGNYKQLKKYIGLYKLDISHFEKKKVEYKKYSLKEILVENSTYSRTLLKKRLYKEGLKKRECELCGQGEEWRGKKMSLILDHINGVNNDNRIENLRIVCPNCNATLDTHAGKNVKHIKKDYFCNCGEKINYNSKNCKKCNDLLKRKVKRPSYEELLKDIKELGYKGTGRKYGVSDNSIRKWEK